MRVHQRPAYCERLGGFLDGQQDPRGFALSDTDDTIGLVDVTDRDVAAIPVGNLRVPRGEFVAVWLAAEREFGRVPGDWYAAGVAVTCRWLAVAAVRPASGPWYVQWAPVTSRSSAAHEELIEAEYVAAEALLARRPVPGWLADRPHWAEGIVDTLRWAWRREAGAPLLTATSTLD